MADVKKQLRYLSPKGKFLFEPLFDKAVVKLKKIRKNYLSDELVVKNAPRVIKSKEKVLKKL